MAYLSSEMSKPEIYRETPLMKRGGGDKVSDDENRGGEWRLRKRRRKSSIGGGGERGRVNGLNSVNYCYTPFSRLHLVII